MGCPIFTQFKNREKLQKTLDNLSKEQRDWVIEELPKRVIKELSKEDLTLDELNFKIEEHYTPDEIL